MWTKYLEVVDRLSDILRESSPFDLSHHRTTTRRGWTGAAVTVSVFLAIGSEAHAQCSGYSITAGPETFVSGSVDIGNHCDDCVTPTSLPFPVNFYGTAYNSVTISSNGTLQFATSSAAYSNVCLPTTTMGPAIFPFWDDQFTISTTNGQGIFTGVNGTAPNRVFVIEWRTNFCCTTAAPVNFYEVKFYEGQDSFDLIYASMYDRSSATVGVQDGSGQFVQYVCEAAGPTPGLSLRVICISTSASGACCIPGTNLCLFVDASGCTAAGGTFVGIAVSCTPGLCDPLGACCSGSQCVLRTHALCTSEYHGDNSICGSPGNPTTCCIANFNTVGGVNVLDIFDFLAAWFVGDPRADINHFNGTNIADIFDFLSLWFSGCE